MVGDSALTETHDRYYVFPLRLSSLSILFFPYKKRKSKMLSVVSNPTGRRKNSSHINH